MGGMQPKVSSDSKDIKQVELFNFLFFLLEHEDHLEVMFA
jgi:hypothetical protein